MTRRHTTGARLTVAIALTLAAAAGVSPASAAPADRLPPDLVGALDQSFDFFTELDGGIYAISGTGEIARIDGDAPIALGPILASTYGLVGFQGALHISALAGDNTFDVLRVEPDGTTTTTLDDGSATDLGGITSIGRAGDALYAASSTVDGALAFTSSDGISWSPAGALAGSPTLIQSIVGIGDDLYVDGTVGGVRGIYRWVAPDWQAVSGLTGEITATSAGIDRLLVGTSEGLFSVAAGAATVLDGTVANVRSVAEFDGEVWWVDDAFELRSIDPDGVRTSHDPVPGGFVVGRLFATDSTLYFTVREQETGVTDSTYRIVLLPTGAPQAPGNPELADTGIDATIFVVGALILMLVGSGLLLAQRPVAHSRD